MPQQVWINLPVKDLPQAVRFYTAIGFRRNERVPDPEQSASFFIGDHDTVLMLFVEPQFARFAGGPVADAKAGAEVLLSIDAQSREEVDALALAAVEAGGSSQHQPSEMKSWMYGCLFSDPDGHRWNALYMDATRIPQ